VVVKIGVLSGKGGVGKTTVSVSLAIALAKKGHKVGILDCDLTGANIHDILGKRELRITSDDKFIPVESNGVKYMSLGLIASDGDPVLWDAKDIRSAARQMFERTEWGDLDYLVIDFPPGFTSETLEMLPLIDYALIVTIPSALSKSKVDRTIEAMREYEKPILGIIINMSYFVCQHCYRRNKIFDENGNYSIPIIAELPFDPKIANNKYIEDFPIDKVLKAIKQPITLKKGGRSLKRKLIKLILGIR